MSTMHPDFFGKIANPDFALAALHGNELHGEFKALVRFAEAGKRPAGMKIMEIHSADLVKIRIRCDQIEHFVENGNVLRVELSEYVSNADDKKGFED